MSLSFDERGRLWVVQYLQYPSGRAEDGQPRRRLAGRLRQGPRPSAPPLPRPRQDHDPRGHRRRRHLRPAQDVRGRPEHRDLGAARPGRRLGAESALSPLLSRPQRRRRARRRPGGPPPGLRPGGHAFGRQQPALGAGRLALRGAGLDGHRPRDAPGPRRGQGARPLDGPAHLAVSPRDAALRGLRRGGRQRLRRRDRRQGPDLLRPQRRRHARLPLRPGGLLPEGLRQARPAVEPLRLRLLPRDEAQPRAPVHAHVRHLRGRRPARAIPRHARSASPRCSTTS